MGFVIVKKDFGGLVFNTPLDDSVKRLYQQVTKGVPLPAVDISTVDLYSALGGYLQQNGLKIKSQATLPTSAVMRLEGMVWTKPIAPFLKEIAEYQGLDKRSTQTAQQGERMEQLLGQWKAYASAYRGK